MATSTFASASSAASIIPVGPPPAITTACICYLPSGLRRAIMGHDRGLHEGPPSGINWRWREAADALSSFVRAVAAALTVGAVASAATKSATPLPVIGISEVNKAVTVTGTPQSGATELDFTTD